MTQRDEGPIEQANEADVVEQQQSLDGGESLTPPDVAPGEADEADVLEQGAHLDTDDDAYPHQAEQEDV